MGRFTPLYNMQTIHSTIAADARDNICFSSGCSKHMPLPLVWELILENRLKSADQPFWGKITCCLLVGATVASAGFWCHVPSVRLTELVPLHHEGRVAALFDPLLLQQFWWTRNLPGSANNAITRTYLFNWTIITVSFFDSTASSV
jgi:hypothetical protein